MYVVCHWLEALRELVLERHDSPACVPLLHPTVICSQGVEQAGLELA